MQDLFDLTGKIYYFNTKIFIQTDVLNLVYHKKDRRLVSYPDSYQSFRKTNNLENPEIEIATIGEVVPSTAHVTLLTTDNVKIKEYYKNQDKLNHQYNQEMYGTLVAGLLACLIFLLV